MVVNLLVLQTVQDGSELGLDPFEFEPLGMNFVEGRLAPLNQRLMHLATRAVVKEANEVGHVARRQSQLTETAGETQRLDVLGWIPPIGVALALHLRQHANPLVVTDSVSGEPGSLSHLTDRQ